MRGKDILKEALNLEPAERFIFVAGRKMVRAAHPTANHSFFGRFKRQMVARRTHAKTGIDVFSVPRFL